MKAKLFFRIAAVLLLLFSAGHTVGFRTIQPEWGVDALLSSMKTIHFNVQGFQRCYYDFYAGFGLFVSVLLVLAAAVCWQLGGLDAGMLKSLKLTYWGLTLCFVVVSFLSWRYFFLVPLVFSSLVTVCLILAALLASRSAVQFHAHKQKGG
jgi:hypothetical protein